MVRLGVEDDMGNLMLAVLGERKELMVVVV